MGKKIKYVEDRPNWHPHPNKAKRQDGSMPWLVSESDAATTTSTNSCTQYCETGQGTIYCDRSFMSWAWDRVVPWLVESAPCFGFWQVGSLSSNLDQSLSAFEVLVKFG